MTGRDWSSRRTRARIAAQGSERARDDRPAPHPWLPTRRRSPAAKEPPKAELRAQAEAAAAEWAARQGRAE